MRVLSYRQSTRPDKRFGMAKPPPRHAEALRGSSIWPSHYSEGMLDTHVTPGRLWHEVQFLVITVVLWLEGGRWHSSQSTMLGSGW